MPLAILLVDGQPTWSGVEVHTLNLALGLQGRGHRVTVASAPGSQLEERSQAAGLSTLAIHPHGKHGLSDYRRLRRWIRSNGLDVVHVHSGRDMFVAPLAALHERVPVRCVTRHLAFPFRSRISTIIYGRIYTRMIGVSQAAAAGIVASGIRDEMVDVIYNSVDVDGFPQVRRDPAELRVQWRIPPNGIVVGVLGRITREKGHRVLMHALSSTGTDSPFTVVIAGEGPDTEPVRALSIELGVADRVRFIGFQTNVSDIMNALDIVAVPSVRPEPCATVILEAMTLGKPVVGTRTGGTPEIIVDGESGLLADGGDAVAFGAALVKVARDPYMRQRMVENASARVREKFSLVEMVNRIEALYERQYQNAGGQR